MENKRWLEENNYYQLKPNSTIYVKDINLEKVFAKIFIDISCPDMATGYSWLYSHGIYSIENKEKLTDEETEEIAILVVTLVDIDFTNYIMSINDEKR